MQKKVIVISFIVVVLIWVGYMITRNIGLKNEQKDSNKDTYQDLIQIAQKSPSGGLVHVGLRLNKYRKEKGAYPERLMDLYPDYLSSEEYLKNIQWDYARTGNDNFLLKKTVTLDSGLQTASIDKSLRIGAIRSTAVAAVQDEAEGEPEEELGVMVASPGSVSKSEPGEMASTDTTVETEASGETEASEGSEEVPEKLFTAATAPEIVSVMKEDIAPGIDPKLGNAYLVWKDEKGRLGFGNVDYPSSYRLSVYSDGMYQDIRKPAPFEQRSSNVLEAATHKKTKDEIASSMGKQILIWKNKDGTLGFGNVDYPEGDNVSSVNVDGTWEEKRKAQP